MEQSKTYSKEQELGAVGLLLSYRKCAGSSCAEVELRQFTSS